MTNMKIDKGPFAGTEIPTNELIAIPNHDGTNSDWWPTANRTPVFLDKFRHAEGWSIEIRHEPGPFNLPDYRNAVQGQATVQPTQLFVAVLMKDGRIVNQASSLEIIDGGKAWERGETNARGRLYEAMGLPGSPKPFLHQLLGDRKIDNPVSTAAGVTIIPIAAPKAQAPAPSVAPIVATTAEPAPVPSADAAPAAASPTPASNEPAVKATEAQVPQTPAPPAKESASQPSTINANLLKQIQVQARIKGVEVPTFADNDAAKAFLKGLLTPQVA
jgi:hypothetical protein